MPGFDEEQQASLDQEPGPPEIGAAPARTPSPIIMYRGGESRAVPTELVEKAASKGWSQSAPSAESPPAQVAPVEQAPAQVTRMYRNGQVRDVPPELLDRARAKGWTEEAPPEAPKDRSLGEMASDAVEYAGEGARKFNQTVFTAAESLLSPLGYHGPLASIEAIPAYLKDLATPGKEANYERSFQDAQRAMLARQEENMVGETIGQFGQGLALGVGKIGQGLWAATESVAPTAAQSLRTIPGMIAKHLLPAEAAVAKGIAGVAATAAAGAGENVLAGAAHEIDQALADGNTTGLSERIAARAWSDAKTGAALGTAFHLAGTAVGAIGDMRTRRAEGAVKEASDDLTRAAIQQRLERDAAQDMADVERREIERTRVKLDALAPAEELERAATQELDRQLVAVAPQPPKATGTIADYTRAYEGHKQFDAHAESSTPELKAALDTIYENSEYASEHLALRAKRHAVRLAENGHAIPIRDPVVTAALDGLEHEIKQLRTSELDPNTPGLRRMEGSIARARALIDGSLAQGDVGDAFNTLDRLKGELGRMANARQSSAAKDMAQRQYNNVFKPLLESQELFGEAGKLQKPFNAVWSPEITAEEADALSGMLGKVGRKSEHNTFVSAKRVQGAWVESFLHNKDVNTDTEDALRQWIATKVASQSVRADLLGDAAGIERAQAARNAANLAISIVNRQAELRVGARAWAGLQEDLASDAIARSAGLVGAVKQGASDIASSTAAKAIGASKIADHLVGRFTKSQLERDLDKAVVAAEKASAARRAAAAKLAEGAKRAQVRLNEAAARVARRKAAASSAREAASKLLPAARRASVVNAVEDAERESSDQAANHGPLSVLVPMVGPQVAQQVAANREARNAFVLQKAGIANAPQSPFGKPKLVLPDQVIAPLGRYIDAADDPMSALERMSSGEATQEDVDTLSALYPDTLQTYRAKALEHLREMPAPTYAEQLAIADRLGTPLLPEQQPQAGAFWLQLAATQKPEPKPPSNRKVKLPDSRTGSGRLG